MEWNYDITQATEADETWESWYHASWDMARNKIENIISSGRYEGDDLHQRILGALVDFAAMRPEVDDYDRSPNHLSGSMVERDVVGWISRIDALMIPDSISGCHTIISRKRTDQATVPIFIGLKQK